MSYMSSANDPDLMNTVIMNSLDDVDMEKPISQEDRKKSIPSEVFQNKPGNYN